MTEIRDFLSPPVDASDHVRGAVDAGVTAVMYGDFQCPFCAAAARVLRRLVEQEPDALRVVFRHFPVTALAAETAALAAEAASAQGQFWPMHDMMFERQAALTPPHLLHYAGELGLDTDRFASDMRASALRERVHRDLASGQASGVDGTPALFVDDLREWILTHDPSQVVHAVREHLGR
jgi:protein-disulfide isomerase